MSNLLDDVSKLTNVPKKYLTKFNTAINYSICDSLKDSILAGNNLTTIDIGIGTLSICVENDTVKYRFVPNKKFDANIKYTIKNKHTLVEYVLEEALKTKVEMLYRDLI